MEEDANTHLWAVSYSDLLMVLLSFFVIFYSAEPESRDKYIIQVTNALATGKSDSGVVAQDSVTNENKDAIPGGLGKRGSTGVNEASTKIVRKSLLDTLSGVNVETVTTDKYLAINFADNFYPMKAYKLTQARQANVNKVLDALKPFAHEIDLYFVGHSDQLPIRNKDKYLRNNFILSSLRATAALEHAIGRGFPPSNLYAQGSAENSRNTRSLSIKVVSKEATPEGKQ